ncbi:unnamed protein product [Vitrella brassicaformis CCMP3155]|uniref:PDZ domain-containing protein n=1 Tax=Vitrella brassicaformis (strain CCMP3155) TaxID=1169540 RepID=A0A0G4EX77_VITBC|nr:unnamed protein product [Vitrella brassicaformis CCMP3155]|eukprot:CEM03607.1 unnamed protein product [Vitrella brassicaformis CCMP3155]
MLAMRPTSCIYEVSWAAHTRERLGCVPCGYVEKVDTEKLFNTAVTAMLRSLDPYTEFENLQAASDLRENVAGRYGGVGLVIAVDRNPPQRVIDTATKEIDLILEAEKPKDDSIGPMASTLRPFTASAEPIPQRIAPSPSPPSPSQPTSPSQRASFPQRGKDPTGIIVMGAFEGYAFDAGMRVGDHLVEVEGRPVANLSPEEVKNMLRGPPDSQVNVAFIRDGVDGLQSVTLTRRLVRVPNVKLFQYLGSRDDGIGYIQLSGFSASSFAEMRVALRWLQQNAPRAGLDGVVLNLRGNPGGLLNSAVDIASLFVPKGSEIVSAQGRSFVRVAYKSTTEPVLDPSVKLVLLTNEATASAAEIVSGAIQDLDCGVIVGTGRTFGKGLVQNVEALPFDTALKYTVAKYYTPSGRCIQSVKYSEGGVNMADASTTTPNEDTQGTPTAPQENNNGPSTTDPQSRRNGRRKADDSDLRYLSDEISESERKVFKTRGGRYVRDGGGIEADVKVNLPKTSPLEITLISQGAMFDYAAEWSKFNEYRGEIDSQIDDIYDAFQGWVLERVKSGKIKLDTLYASQLNDLGTLLKELDRSDQSYTKAVEKGIQQLREDLAKEIKNDFVRNAKELKLDLADAIKQRYLPDTLRLSQNLQYDPMVATAIKLLQNNDQYQAVLTPRAAQRSLKADASAQTAATPAAQDTALSQTPTAERRPLRQLIFGLSERVWARGGGADVFPSEAESGMRLPALSPSLPGGRQVLEQTSFVLADADR